MRAHYLFRCLVCADLQSVPLLGKRGDASAMFDLDSGDRERSLRMAGLLGFSKNPKREWLLAEMVSKNVGSQVCSALSHSLFEASLGSHDISDMHRG